MDQQAMIARPRDLQSELFGWCHRYPKGKSTIRASFRRQFITILEIVQREVEKRCTGLNFLLQANS